MLAVMDKARKKNVKVRDGSLMTRKADSLWSVVVLEITTREESAKGKTQSGFPFAPRFAACREIIMSGDGVLSRKGRGGAEHHSFGK